MVVNENVRRLAPSVRPFVQELFTSGLFSHHDINLFAPNSGLSPYEISESESSNSCDRFKLVISCAGYPITWEVIFDAACSAAAPDFIFDDESFLCYCDLVSLPSLVNWDSSDFKAFVNVISDLLKLNSKHQLQEAAKNINPSVGKWLDVETVEDKGLKVEVLHGSHMRIPSLTVSRQSILQNGYTSVVVKVPVSCDLVDCRDMQFSLQYIFKSHSQQYEEKIECSPHLETWLQPFLDNFKKRNRWIQDSKALSDCVQSYTKEITDLLRKSVQDYKNRQELQMSLCYHIMSKTEARPSILELDFNDFQFSSYLISENRLFNVDFCEGVPRGHLFYITEDCVTKPLTCIKGNSLTDPKFDILSLLQRFNQ